MGVTLSCLGSQYYGRSQNQPRSPTPHPAANDKKRSTALPATADTAGTLLLLQQEQLQKQQQEKQEQQQHEKRQRERRTACPQYGKDGYIVMGQLGSEKDTLMKLMRNKKTRELVASKWVPRQQGSGLVKSTEREIINHKKLVHPNIIAFKEVYLTETHLVIVIEYASGGPLEERMLATGPLTEDTAKQLFRQLVDGLAFCHKKNIFHRNLRMDNLLLEGSYFDSVLKISNFGYSKSAVLDSAMDTKGLSEPAYSSPELLSGHKEAAYDGAAVDVWAAGVILYCLLTGHLPFLDPGMPSAITGKVMQRIIKGDFKFPANVQVSPECIDLLRHIFTPDPDKRIKTESIKQHSWLSGIALPKEALDVEVEPAAQTEDDISAVVRRARQRRAKWQLSQQSRHSPSSPRDVMSPDSTMDLLHGGSS